jgi:hypothetical protein
MNNWYTWLQAYENGLYEQFKYFWCKGRGEIIMDSGANLSHLDHEYRVGLFVKPVGKA